MQVLRNGTLVSWGINSDGQMDGRRTNEIWEPVASPLFLAEQGGTERRWEQVALGVRFTVALERETLQVYTWGMGEHGSLGLGDNANRTVPVRNDGFTRVGVRKLAAGWCNAEGRTRAPSLP